MAACQPCLSGRRSRRHMATSASTAPGRVTAQKTDHTGYSFRLGDFSPYLPFICFFSSIPACSSHTPSPKTESRSIRTSRVPPVPLRSARERRTTSSGLAALSSKGGDVIRVYFCNRSWRFILFANYRYKVGGLTYAPFSNNIFLRAANIAADRLVGPSGKEVTGERTLSYFIAHEITHTLLCDELWGRRLLEAPCVEK